MIKIDLSLISTSLLFKSSIKPIPSVLSPDILPSSEKLNVLTAPHSFALLLKLSLIEKACFLNGSVTFKPFPPLVKKLSTCSSKDFTSASSFF